MKQMLMSQLAVQIRGVSYKPDDLHKALDKNSIALLRANNIGDGKINFNDLVYVDRSKVSNNQLLRQGDILICASSGSKNLVGKAAQIDFDCEITFGAFCKVARPTTVESDYLGMYFQSPIYRKIVSSLAQGANINNIKNADIDNLLVNIPNNGTQKKMVEIFKRMQSIIRNRQQQLQKLDELVKARFVELFGDPKINPNNYLVCPLSEYISFLTSGSRGWAQYCTDNGSEWFITIKNVKDCHISTDNMQPIDAPDNAEAKRTKVQEGDLLISITADLGRTGVVTKEIAEHGAYINQHLTCIRLNKTVLNPLYVAYFMESPAGKEQFELKNQSAVKAGLNFNSIKSLRIMIPSINEQNMFVEFLNQTDKSKVAVQKSLDEAQLLFDSLMQQYFG